AECLARPILAERLVRECTGGSTIARGAPKAFASRQADPSDAAYKLPEISAPFPCTGDDAWAATTTVNAPDAREFQAAVWTGSEKIVWGGAGCGSNRNLITGGRYNPTSDSWTPTSIVNAPTARFGHTALWTGSEMIVWGGSDRTNDLHTGARYNLSTD